MHRERSARRWWTGAAVGLIAMVAVSNGWQAATVGAAPTTTTAPLSLAQWKDQYEPAIGEIADDALVVVDTGRRDAKKPTEKKVHAILTACRHWHDDAENLPGEVPPIPLASAEKTWQRLITASISGSADCAAALERGSKSATNRFQKQLALVNIDERKLIGEIGGSSQ